MKHPTFNCVFVLWFPLANEYELHH